MSSAPMTADELRRLCTQDGNELTRLIRERVVFQIVCFHDGSVTPFDQIRFDTVLVKDPLYGMPRERIIAVLPDGHVIDVSDTIGRSDLYYVLTAEGRRRMCEELVLDYRETIAQGVLRLVSIPETSSGTVN